MKTNFVNNSVKAAKRAAFLLSLLVVIVLTVSALLGCVYLLVSLISVFCITGIAARVVLSFFFLLGPAFEVAMNIETNALAVVERLFPAFCNGRRSSFEVCSFWARTFCEK
jgi:hypothetical protein